MDWVTFCITSCYILQECQAQNLANEPSLAEAQNATVILPEEITTDLSTEVQLSDFEVVIRILMLLLFLVCVGICSFKYINFYKEFHNVSSITRNN